MKKSWLNKHTYHHSEFIDLNKLVTLKEERDLSISLCIPTLNEEKTIAKEVVIMKSELVQKHPLLDEIIVIDSNSTDRTAQVAEEYGAKVYISKEILPKATPHYKGKGENLWKALYVAKGDIIVYLDADIKNIHHRFVYGLVGPLLMNDKLKYTKAFYDRPIVEETGVMRPSGGGRVTELVIRPLFSLLYPDLTQIIQPLSGEYAAYRSVLDKLTFPIGYGIETSMLMEIYERWGLEVMAQVDLDRRVHRNQDTLSLGRMSFGILQTFCRRLEKQSKVRILDELFDTMIQYKVMDKKYTAETYRLQEHERPPMIDRSEYRKKFRIQKTSD
jgi:glucosyl-3-phosphoglycerate synthase